MPTSRPPYPGPKNLTKRINDLEEWISGNANLLAMGEVEGKEGCRWIQRDAKELAKIARKLLGVIACVPEHARVDAELDWMVQND